MRPKFLRFSQPAEKAPLEIGHHIAMNLAGLRHRIILKRGSDLLRRGDWQNASSILGRAARLAPRHWESHNNLAIALLKLGRWEEAAAMAQRAIRLAPNAADSHDYFGVALLQMARWEEAVAAYRRAIEVDPKRYDSYDRLGMALLRLSRWNEVIETYEKALKLSAGRHTAHHRLGIALLQMRRWDDAAAAFRRAIELAERDTAVAHEIPELLTNLASAVGQLEVSEDVVNALRQTAALNPDAATRLTLGVQLLKLERWDEAVTQLAGIGARIPGPGTPHFLQVDALLRVERPSEAIAAHHRAVEAGGAMPALPGTSAAARFERRRDTFWATDNLGAEVFAVEAWLEHLSRESDQAPAGAQLLFVLDNDFGELTTVKYFLLGQQMAGRTTLLLPERLHVHNADAIPGRTHRYASVEDILRAVDLERPEIVFLCSGYLFWQHLGFAPEDLARLVDALRARGCRVVTADPFLGMLSKEDPRSLIHIDIPTSHPVWTVEQLKEMNRPLEERMWAAFGASEQILRDTYHLYPGYCGVAEDEKDARNVAFYNDRLVRPAPARPERSSKPRAHWLFVLTAADCLLQMLFEGETGFADIVAKKLVETRAAGRHAILIGPQEFLDRLIARMPTAEGIDILPHCPFNRFMSLLLGAEHVFYWNAVSHSLLVRLFNQLPIVLFDRGHLLRNADGIRDRLVGWYYQGWEPVIRDHREPLTVDTVEGWASAYREQSARLAERYRRAPSPEQMIAELMQRPVVARN